MAERKISLIHIIVVILLVFLTSLYIFHVTRIVVGISNSKNIIAAIGLALFLYEAGIKKTKLLPGNILWVIISSLAVSLVSYFAMVYNNTSDNTYVLHIRSVLIWISGGYCVCRAIKWHHGKLSFRIVGQYVVGVLLWQCLIALLIDEFPTIAVMVHRYFYDAGTTSFLLDAGRLYGIGAMLDVAGVRFSAMFVVLGALIVDYAKEKKYLAVIIGLGVFGFATFIGNMIARTTTVGVAVCIGYWLCMTLYHFWNGESIRRLWGLFIIVGLITYGIGSYSYNHNEKMRENIRFGFEGFFSLVEKGHWETNSNNELKDMIKWPDNTKTWTIGDGYMMDPTKVESYLKSFNAYGEVFYMGTDAGYCRFIFYFGIIGLSIMLLLFFVSTAGAIENHPDHKFALLCILLVNLIVWIKVSTDVFAILSIFLAFREGDEDEETATLEEQNNQ